jgi:hypothetical protein
MKFLRPRTPNNVYMKCMNADRPAKQKKGVIFVVIFTEIFMVLV